MKGSVQMNYCRRTGCFGSMTHAPLTWPPGYKDNTKGEEDVHWDGDTQTGQADAIASTLGTQCCIADTFGERLEEHRRNRIAQMLAATFLRVSRQSCEQTINEDCAMVCAYVSKRSVRTTFIGVVTRTKN